MTNYDDISDITEMMITAGKIRASEKALACEDGDGLGKKLRILEKHATHKAPLAMFDYHYTPFAAALAKAVEIYDPADGKEEIIDIPAYLRNHPQFEESIRSARENALAMHAILDNSQLCLATSTLARDYRDELSDFIHISANFLEIEQSHGQSMSP